MTVTELEVSGIGSEAPWTIPEGFVVLDGLGRWIGACPSWRPLLERMPPPSGGRPFLEFLSPACRALWAGRWLLHRRGENVPAFEVTLEVAGSPRVLVTLAEGGEHLVVARLKQVGSRQPSGQERLVSVMRSLYSRFPSGVVLMDLEGRVLWVNDSAGRMGGRAWVGAPFSRCLPGTGLGRVLGKVARTAEAGRMRGLDVKAAGLGPIRHVDMVLSRVDDACAIGMGLLAMIEDATNRVEDERERQRMVAEQTHVERLKNQFLSAASHELRTPLSLITGFAEFLEDGLGGELTPSQEEFVRGIQLGARQLQQMVDDLLDFSRLQDGTFTLEPQVIEVSRLLQQVVSSLASRAREASVHLAWHESDNLLPAYADPEAVARVVHALVGNALKFTPPGGHVEVRARLSDGRLLIEVEDDGIGIPAEHLPHVFERFYQADPGLTRLHGGAGLGLSVARGLVEGQRGRIGVKSQPGVGSRFWFTLPSRPRTGLRSGS